MPTYKAKIQNTGAPSGGSLLHLIAEGAPSTVCGKVRADKLTTAGGFDEQICPACIELLPRPSGLEPLPTN